MSSSGALPYIPLAPAPRRFACLRNRGDHRTEKARTEGAAKQIIRHPLHQHQRHDPGNDPEPHPHGHQSCNNYNVGHKSHWDIFI